ncbi:MAG TPA: sugar phosphate isomerase/epimerase [Tepidisphaeraceae bacterium]|jgi:sugar phosphate isomerase/epimerase|nr:sugar phosphate isomerase/epimerase [Tepidisphaeraceae bacterium]
MIDLAFSTNAFKKNTLEEAIEAIARIGYGGVEMMADVPHAYPQNMDEQRIGRIRERFKQLGLSVSNVNAFTLFACGDTYHPTWIEDDEAKRRTRIEHTLRSIELANTFEAKTISLQPGGPLIGTTISRQLAGERFAEGLRQVVPAAKSAGVTLAIEPEPGLFIESSAEYVEFKRTYFDGEPQVKMNCDIGHLFCVGDDPVEVIRGMAEQIAHVHLEDIGENRVHQHLTPGKGAIDFPRIFAALADIKYTGRVTVELYPYETTAAGVAKAAWEHLQPML